MCDKFGLGTPWSRIPPPPCRKSSVPATEKTSPTGCTSVHLQDLVLLGKSSPYKTVGVFLPKRLLVSFSVSINLEPTAVWGGKKKAKRSYLDEGQRVGGVLGWRNIRFSESWN
ncbi:hypothetical protein TNIN_82101 [Trichonephila inaurata madagascariensis]|uniref:Uncharacterized protein n=1 Tax=Trichonephila inaurata madagascariensis TaxID=2747483 RepID=A0A8X6I7C0_9ARAC|nr:hypothetical protein TNIN_82101 [Trichonephila inaurata madagascariensis]